MSKFMFKRCDVYFVVFKQMTAYELRISDWSSDVCSSDLASGDEFGRDPLVDHALRKPAVEGFAVLFSIQAGHAHRHAAHRLHAAGDHDVVCARRYALRGEIDRKSVV